MKRLELTEIARADLKSIRRYSQRTWGVERTKQYMTALRDAMKGLIAGKILSRERNDVLLPHIFPICSVVASCQRGASPPSVRRRTFTTGC